MMAKYAPALTDLASRRSPVTSPRSGVFRLSNWRRPALAHLGNVQRANEDHYLVARFDRTFRPFAELRPPRQVGRPGTETPTPC